MKNLFGILIIMSAFMMSCTSSGNKAETKAAKEVKVEKDNATIEYNTVTNDSHLEWRASHLGGVQKRFGKIRLADANVLVNDGKVTNANVTVDISSLTVENFPEGAEETEKLRGHLLSGDFFEVEKYPTSKFVVTSVQPTSGEYNSKVTGNLTILDKTKSITFSANINVTDSQVTIQSEDFVVDRTDWGLTYNTEGTAGVPVDYLISDDVGFTVNVTVGR